MEQFEQLLTCAICLDRYRNPKLLPCQHSFCMEPCLEGLVDYVRRQIKCPECRAEHRIPYQGVQGYPTNVTLQRFLELHIEITGELPDPTSGQIMERCNVCSEKAYCNFCSHCDKKVCPDCKGAHMDILRREITRINNQIRRSIHRLQDSLSLVEKSTQNIQTNCSSVSEEVSEIYRRLSKALKDRTDFLRGEVDRYLGTELRSLTSLKENLEQEISNILSNCDLADKHINENVDWDDCELVDAKEIFLKTVEFIRNFEYENTDYSRKVRLILAHDPNQLVLHLAGYGDLNITNPQHQFGVSGGGNNLLQPPGGPGLMRSKSDHRLASQFRQQEEMRNYEKGYGDANPEDLPLGGRKFGDRSSRTAPTTERYDRYGRGGGNEYGEDYEETRPARSRYRSRYNRHSGADNDSDTETTGRGVRFTEQHKEKEKIIDTEEVTRGPLSGIQRLADSPRVMKKLQENETNKKKEKENPTPPPAQTQPKVTALPKKPPIANRQVSEEDEISKIKKQNKGATTSSTTEATERTVHKREEPADDKHTRKTSVTEAAASSGEESDTSNVHHNKSSNTTNKTPPATIPAKRPTSTDHPKKAIRSTSSDSTTSTESSASSALRNSSNTNSTTQEQPRTRTSSVSSNASKDSSTTQKPFQSRFLHSRTPSAVAPVPTKEEDDEEETTSEEETESEEESEEETEKTPAKKDTMAKTDIGPLLARSAHARDSAEQTNKPKEEPSYTRSRYTKDDDSTPSYTRTRPQVKDDEPSSYGGYTNRFTNKSKSAVGLQDQDDDRDDKYASPKSRYSALKDRRQRLARSKSSHVFGDDDETDEPISPTTANPSVYMASRGYSSAASSGNELSRSRSSHALKSRENSPDRANGPEKDGAALSSWARYLKNKYGNRSTGKDKDSSTGSSTSPSASSSSAARRLSLGLPLRSTDVGSSDDDSKNMQGSPTTPTAATVAAAGIAAAAAGTSPKEQYLIKGHLLFKIGGRGSEPGLFTWPRGVAVGPDNSIIVADSSNHRVQVFDANGNFVKEFGQYGNGEGEFDCLAGVAVNRIGQYIIADRYNHRIQVFDPAGRFLRAFGSQGTADGRFNYPWGITTDALGFIYVCDKENHRVQVFQSDGTFVGKFGCIGSKPGQLEHPHYIAVSNTNRVIVSDSNNHRIQIFDVNGKVLSTFGSEGSSEGQFKFPRGVAVDDQGFICVADSGNNRIQIFHPDGTFLKSFGSWGSIDGEFKGLEGVAVSSSGNILVCDRENHRIQVF